MKKTSQPGLPAENERSLSEPETTGINSRIRPTAPADGPISADNFGDRVNEIRRNTGALFVDKIIKMQLSEDASIAEFPENARKEWVEIIFELMTAAKAAMAESTAAIDFYVKFRQLKDDEERKPASQKLLLVERLSTWLSGKSFVYKTGVTVTTWKVERCTISDLSAAAPAFLAKNETAGETQQVQLFQVLAGLKIS